MYIPYYVRFARSAFIKLNFNIYNNKNIKTFKMQLTPDQELALVNIINFIYIPVKERVDVAGILHAPAGCGKTFLTKIIADRVNGTHRMCGIAPTHKARKVLDNFLNKGRMLVIKTTTIASILNKMRGHSYIGTKNYVNGSSSKMNLFDLYLIDEASMITDNDIEMIINYAFQYKRKVLFIGDKFQIPNPSQKYICKNGFATKRDASAFELVHQFELTTNVRQHENNPIINLYTELRKSISKLREPKLVRETKISENGEQGVCFYTDSEKWLNKFYELYKNWGPDKHNIRMIAYTNGCVKSNNLSIRRLFKRGPIPEVGEILMGYNNLGWPEPIIENSQDYYVAKVLPTSNHVIYDNRETFTELVGNIITITEPDSINSNNIFMLDISNEKNKKILKQLVYLADRVNQKKSTKEHFKEYCVLKNQMVFMENIYKFNEHILGENEFKTANPLLFKSVKDIIDDGDDGDRSILKNKLSTEITDKYGNLLTERMQDDKPVSGAERFCDKYCVIEKDIDYGACITAHKSQGSSFNTVFVDESDFDKLQDYWSFDLDCKIKAVKERNQLKYVSFTRPTNFAHVFYI